MCVSEKFLVLKILLSFTANFPFLLYTEHLKKTAPN